MILKKVETLADFIFLVSKITIEGYWRHEIKNYLLLGRKAMTKLDSILKSQYITLPIKVCIVITMVFSDVMYRCESWTIGKAKHWRTDAFKMWCWRRLLRVPWTARRSNQSILNEISPEYSLEGLMPKLKLQYLASWYEELTHGKRLKAKGEGGNRIRWLDGIISSMDMSLNKFWEIVKDGEAWHVVVHRVVKSWMQLSDWTTTYLCVYNYFFNSLSNIHFYCSEGVIYSI